MTYFRKVRALLSVFSKASANLDSHNGPSLFTATIINQIRHQSGVFFSFFLFSVVVHRLQFFLTVAFVRNVTDPTYTDLSFFFFEGVVVLRLAFQACYGEAITGLMPVPLCIFSHVLWPVGFVASLENNPSDFFVLQMSTLTLSLSVATWDIWCYFWL